LHALLLSLGLLVLLHLLRLTRLLRLLLRLLGMLLLLALLPVLPLLLLGLWSVLLLRCAFVLPALRPVGLTLLLMLFLALTVVLGVQYHRSGKQEDGGRSSYSHF
jgi:hypothetical protein